MKRVSFFPDTVVVVDMFLAPVHILTINQLFSFLPFWRQDSGIMLSFFSRQHTAHAPPYCRYYYYYYYYALIKEQIRLQLIFTEGEARPSKVE